MSLTRFYPTPSDRMAIVWSLLGIDQAIILEYGPAGTTHYGIGFYAGLDLALKDKVFTTHMSEDDVVMGDVSRLEEAILELDAIYQPKIIFVLASSISSVIGTDVKGVCRTMQGQVQAKILPFTQGGLSGDYSAGIKLAHGLLGKAVIGTDQTPCDLSRHYNVLGASGGAFRVRSDLWELQNMLQEGFGLKQHASLCVDVKVDAIATMQQARFNVVLSFEGLALAQRLEKKYKQPYLYLPLLGYQASLDFLEAVGELLQEPVDPGLKARLQKKARQLRYYRMNRTASSPKARLALVGDYDRLKGLKALFEGLGMECTACLCLHGLKDVPEPVEGMEFLKTEAERLALIKGLKPALFLGDEVSCEIASFHHTKAIISLPLTAQSQVAHHRPLLGERGMDELLEVLDAYLHQLH